MAELKIHHKLVVAVVLALASTIFHFLFSLRTPLNIDEPIYIFAGYNYASYVQKGQPELIIQDDFNAEHPAFTKLIYGGIIWIDWQLRGSELSSTTTDYNTLTTSEFQATPNFIRYFIDARFISSVIGIVLIITLTLYEPVAGFFALISTTFLRYTTLAYLEASGLLFSTLAILAYSGYNRRGTSFIIMGLAGICTGLAAASKYYYGVVGIIILGSWLWKSKPFIKSLWIKGFIFIIFSLITFTLADPPFWTQGVPTLLSNLQAGGIEYRSGWSDMSQAYKFTTPGTISIFEIASKNSQLNVLALKTDLVFLIVAFYNLVTDWSKQTFIKYWFIVTVTIVAIYPVKFPQYNALMVVPAFICAARATNQLWQGLFMKKSF